MADDSTTEDDADDLALAGEVEECSYSPDYVLQRTGAFLSLALSYDKIPPELRDDAKAFLGVIMRSIRTYNDKGEVSKLRQVKTP
jgi:hypothetical protein